MKTIVKYAYIISSIIFLIYLIIPNAEFPEQVPDSIKSYEPADIETTLRKGYYTNYQREEVITYYQNNLKLFFLNLNISRYRLNYPPEEAQQLIRDQARSTYLEELVHPFRDSYFINGFEPEKDKDMIFIESRKWYQKVIVKYIPSTKLNRIMVGLLIIFIIPFIYILYNKTLVMFFKKNTIFAIRKYYGF